MEHFPKTLKLFNKDEMIDFYLKLSEKMLKEIKPKSGFALSSLLIVLAVLITLAGGMVVWEKKISPTPTPTPTPTINKEPTPTLIPSEAETTKMPWEDSVCGNGICERCESRSECCNYPCVTDPISGNQMCPPPTCLGWCEKDCTNITLAPTPITSCQTDTDCKNACAVPNFGLKVYHEVCIQGKCILEPCN